MQIYIALLRGINVGGNNILPMKELVQLLEQLGFLQVKTYIQSGNVVFISGENNTPELRQKIRTAIQKKYGFEPHVFLLTSDELAQAISVNPFPEAEQDFRSLHLYFIESDPVNPDFNRLENLRKDNERFKLAGRVFYLHAPDGIGQSKLAERVEKALDVMVTARNWRSVCEIKKLADACKDDLQKIIRD